MAKKSRASGTPKYVAVHAAVRELGQATNGQLSEKLRLDSTQVTGALVALLRIGAVRRAARGIWEALELPTDYPRKRGRPRSGKSARAQVLDVLRAEGESLLSTIVDRLSEGEDDRSAARARAAHALVTLAKEGVVAHVGTRGTYRYRLATAVAS